MIQGGKKTEPYEDLDEVVARYVEPYLQHFKEMQKHKRFRDGSWEAVQVRAVKDSQTSNILGGCTDTIAVWAAVIGCVLARPGLSYSCCRCHADTLPGAPSSGLIPCTAARRSNVGGHRAPHRNNLLEFCHLPYSLGHGLVVQEQLKVEKKRNKGPVYCLGIRYENPGFYYLGFILSKPLFLLPNPKFNGCQDKFMESIHPRCNCTRASTAHLTASCSEVWGGVAVFLACLHPLSGT